MVTVMNGAHAFINLSYRDAATKTVPQAISCGLPVLFTDSGGVPEMVGNYGVAINDAHPLDSEESIPNLSIDNVAYCANRLIGQYPILKQAIKAFDRKAVFKKMLDNYFSAITSVLK